MNQADRPELETPIRKAIAWAQRAVSWSDNSGEVEMDTLLLGVLLEPSSEAGRRLRSLGADPGELARELGITVGTMNTRAGIGLSDAVRETLEKATNLAFTERSPQVTTIHLMTAMLEDRGGACVQLLATFGITQDKALERLGVEITSITPIAETMGRPGDIPVRPLPKEIASFCEDITAQARRGYLDPVLERDGEITRVAEVLRRRIKANPLLVGPAGVGKTAVVEGVAQQLLDDYDPKIRNSRVISLSMLNLYSQTKFRGEMEAKIKRLIEFCESDPSVILFIDEIHNLIATKSDGMGIGDILKPALSRGRMRCIGATTPTEARALETDGALMRRFQTVNVEPPSREATIGILQGLRPIYEAHHHVRIPDSVLMLAVDWSARYLHQRVWPDSAIDLMEDGATVLVAKNGRHKTTDDTVTPAHLAEALATQTRIPAAEILGSDGANLLKLEDSLHERVIGQDRAISAIAKALRRSRAGLRDPQRPIGSFLFVGPTGVGKTEVAKTLANLLFHDEDAMVRLDMSEFADQHSLSRLLGAPPGYVGSKEGGRLTEAIRRNPYCVVLFDEIEKAHPDISNILLQMLDAGRLTDAHGKSVNTTHVIFIATSNVGHGLDRAKSIGFLDTDTAQRVEKRWMSAAQAAFPPELINRLDAIVPFHPLTIENCLDVANLQIKELADRVSHNCHLDLTVDRGALESLVQGAISPEYGARELRRAIQEQIENPVTEYLLTHTPEPGTTLVAIPGSSTPVECTEVETALAVA